MWFHNSQILTFVVLATANFLYIAESGFVIQKSVQPFQGRLKAYASPPPRNQPPPFFTKTYPRSPPAYAAENELLAQALKMALRNQGAVGQRSPGTSDIEIHKAKLSEQFVLPQTRNSPVVVQNYVVQPPEGYEAKQQRTQWTPISPVRNILPNRNIVQYRHSESKSPPVDQVKQVVRANTKHMNNFIPQAIQIADSYEVPDNNNFNSQSIENVKYVEERPQQQVVYRVEAKNQQKQQFTPQVTQSAAVPVQNVINISPSDPSQVLQGTSEGYTTPPQTKNQVVQVNEVRKIQPEVTTTVVNNEISTTPAIRQEQDQGYNYAPAVTSQKQGQVKVHTTYEFYKHSEPQLITPLVISSQPEQKVKEQSGSFQYQSTQTKTLSAEEEFPFPTVSIASDTPRDAPVTTYEPQAQLQEVSVNSLSQSNQGGYSQPQQSVKSTQSQAQSYKTITAVRKPEGEVVVNKAPQQYTVSKPQQVFIELPMQAYSQSQVSQGYISSQQEQNVPHVQKQVIQQKNVPQSQIQSNQVIYAQTQQNANVPLTQGYAAAPPQPAPIQQPEPVSVNKVQQPQQQQYVVTEQKQVVVQQSNQVAPQSQPYVVSQAEKAVRQVQEQVPQPQNLPKSQVQLQAVNVNNNQVQNVGQFVYSQPQIAFIPVQQQQQQYTLVSQSPQFVIPQSQPQQFIMYQPQTVSIPVQQVVASEQPQTQGYVASHPPPPSTVPKSEGYPVQSENTVVSQPQLYQQQEYVVNQLQPQQIQVQNQQPQLQQVFVTQQSPDQIIPQLEQVANANSQTQFVFQVQPQHNEIQEPQQQQYEAPQSQEIDEQVSNSESQQYNNVVSQPEPEQTQTQSESSSSPITITEPIINNHQESQVQEVIASSQYDNAAPAADHSSNVVFVNTAIHPAPGETPRQPIAEISPSEGQENHQIIVVKTPNQMVAQTTYQVEVAPNPPQETKVYVLQSQPEVNHEVTVTHPQQSKQPDPEIHFVRYADSDILPHHTISEFNRVTEERGPTAKTYDMYAPQMPHQIYYTHPVYSS